MKPDDAFPVASRLAVLVALLSLTVTSLAVLPSPRIRMSVRLDTAERIELRAHAAGHRFRLVLSR